MQEISFPKFSETGADAKSVQKQGAEFPEQRFADLFWASLEKVNALQHQADHAIREMAAGRQRDIHRTMIAIEKAEISFQLLMKVRNKIISAYEEIMRMSI